MTRDENSNAIPSTPDMFDRRAVCVKLGASACEMAQLCADRPRRCVRSLLDQPCPTLTPFANAIEDQADHEEVFVSCWGQSCHACRRGPCLS